MDLRCQDFANVQTFFERRFFCRMQIESHGKPFQFHGKPFQFYRNHVERRMNLVHRRPKRSQRHREQNDASL